MNSSCKKCWGQIIYEKWKKYSKCSYCWFQNYFSIYNEIGNKKIIHYLIFFILFLLVWIWFFLSNNNSTINNWEIINYNAESIVVENKVIEKQIIEKKIIVEKEELGDQNIDLHNCVNQESTRRYNLTILPFREQILKSESNYWVAFDSNNLLKVKFYYLIWEEKNWKWVTEKQEKMTEMKVYWATYNQNPPTNNTLIPLAKKLDWKKFKLVAYWFGIHNTCEVRVVSDQIIYVQPYFDLSKNNIWKDIDLVVEDVLFYDKKSKNNLWKEFSKDKIVHYVPVIKNIWKDSAYFNFDNLKFSKHSDNWDLSKLNWVWRCSNENVELKSGEVYTCLWELEYWWNWFSKEENKKIVVWIDYWNNIEEVNEDNNIKEVYINITD